MKNETTKNRTIADDCVLDEVIDTIGRHFPKGCVVCGKPARACNSIWVDDGKFYCSVECIRKKENERGQV